MRLAILTSHPIQYYAPLFRELARRLDVHVFFAHRPSAQQQAQAGFGHAFEWDLELTSGYAHTFLLNRARSPGADHYAGCDTPDIGNHLTRSSFDAVLLMGWHLKFLHQGLLAAKRAKLPVLVRGDSQLTTPRSTAKRLAKQITYPVLLRAFDAALYVGRRNLDYYRRYSYPEARLFRSPHCIETDRFTREATPQKRAAVRERLAVSDATPLILFAGKLIPFKRPLDLIEAVAHLRRDGCPAEALVAGSGELEDPMRARARDLDVPLHMLGFQNQTEMPAAYAAGDALVLPSTGRETWGLVCNEALACGLPIVVSEAVGCAPDLAGDGNVGRTFPLGDIAACASALGSLLSHGPSLSEIRQLSERHSIAAAADGVLEALHFLERR